MNLPNSRGTGNPENRPRALAIGLLVAAAVLPYLNALRGGFLFDDILLVSHHKAVTGPFHPWLILKSPYWESIREALLWRPVTTFGFAVDWHVGGGSPTWFHAANIALHALVTLLWVWFIRRISGRGSLALVAGLLFAVHPVHTEAVTWISGRSELLAAGFTLAALHLAWSPRLRWWTPLAVLLAVGSKESAAAVPIVLLFFTWAFRRRREDAPPWSVGIVSLAPVLLYVVLRRAALGAWGGPSPDPMDNPMVGLGFFARLPTVLDAAGRYLVLLIWPARLSIDYSAPVLNVIRSLTPQLLLGLAGLGGLVFLALRRRERPEGWGSGFALMSFGLTANLVMVIGTIFAERLLYLPSAGLLLVAACGGLALARDGSATVREENGGRTAPHRVGMTAHPRAAAFPSVRCRRPWPSSSSPELRAPGSAMATTGTNSQCTGPAFVLPRTARRCATTTPSP